MNPLQKFRKLSFLALWLPVFIAGAQVPAPETMLADYHCTLVTDSAVLQLLTYELQVVNNTAIKNRSDSLQFTPEGNWKFAFYVTNGWSSIIPNEITNYCNFYIANKPTSAQSAGALIAKFNATICEQPDLLINDSFAGAFRFYGPWFAYMPVDDYLVFFLNHSYPNGNLTSFLHQYKFYFKRVNE